MSGEDEFEPRPGKPRARGGKAAKTFQSRVLRAAMLASGGAFGKAGRNAPGRAFKGSRIGRGAGVAGVIVAGDRWAAFRTRRVIVKVSIVRLTGKGLQGARAHLRYVQRDGVTRDGAPGQLYADETDRADGKAFVDRAEAGGDARQFRIIVSAEDGAEYEDLKPLVRRLMRQAQQDLGTRLDWVAVDHHNTGHPHSHILVRGRDERGQDLIIAKDYLTRGFRERAAELVSLDLGPRTDREIENRLRSEVEKERLTGLDRSLLRDVGEGGLVSPRHGDPLQYACRIGRLRTLQRLGLAEEVAPQSWRLADGLEDTLRRMGERGDIQKTLHRALLDGGVDRAHVDQVIFDPGEGGRPLVGRVVRRGLSDEGRDRRFLVVDGVDGRAHYVDLGQTGAVDLVPEGAVVRVSPRSTQARVVDQTVARIAALNGGRYSIDLHLAADPSATADFAQAHVRRLEAMRRGRVAVERLVDGTWVIGSDHVAVAQAYERGVARSSPVTVETLSPSPVQRQVLAVGATWLDRELLADAPEPLRDAGFGRELRLALAQRRQWLIEQGLAEHDDGRTIYRGGLLETLRRRELVRAGTDLTREIGAPYMQVRPAERIEGVFRKRVDLESGRFALIERSRDFTLVPWMPALEGREGRIVAGIVRPAGVSWSLGRGRDGPMID